jgi:hypothetical protein
MDDITRAIEGATDRIIAYRLIRLIEKRGILMPLEIKGLKGKALKARANIDALNAAYDKFNEAAPAHAADVEGLTSQVSGMQDDLQFAVNVLGNSTSESEKLDDPPKPATTPAPNDMAPTAAPPAVGEQPASTFPGQ